MSDLAKLPWLPLLTSPPTGWQRLSLLTRGVGDELLRAFDGNGEIDCGRDDAFDVVCRITGAHPRERRRVKDALDEMLSTGFLAIDDRDGGRVIRGLIPDLVEALSARRARGAKRPRNAPEAPANSAQSTPDPNPNIARSDPAADLNRARSVPEAAGNVAEQLVSGPVDQRRSEEIRGEKRRGEIARAVAVVEPDGFDERCRRCRGAIVRAYAVAWHRDERRGPWVGPGQHAAALDGLARWAAQLASEPDETATVLVDAFFASTDDYVSKARWSLGLLAKDPGRYMPGATGDGRIADGHGAGVVALERAKQREVDPEIVPGEPSATMIGLARGELLVQFGVRAPLTDDEEDAIDVIARACARRSVGASEAARVLHARVGADGGTWGSIARQVDELLRTRPKPPVKVTTQTAAGAGAEARR